MFSLEKRRLSGGMIGLFKYLKACHTEEEQDLFLIIPEYRTTQQWAQVKGIQNLIAYQEKLLNWSNTTGEPVTLGVGEAFKKNLDNNLADML